MDKIELKKQLKKFGLTIIAGNYVRKKDIAAAMLDVSAKLKNCKNCGSTIVDSKGYCHGSCPYSDWPQVVDLQDIYKMTTRQIEQKYKVKKKDVRIPKLSEVDDYLSHLGFEEIPYEVGYLMGSRAKGTHKDDSDIDITLVVPNSWNPKEFEDLEELNDAIINSREDDGNINYWDIQVWYQKDPRIKKYKKVELKW